MKICHCGEAVRHDQRSCLICHAAYMRAWRKVHKLSPEQKKKDNSRSYAGVYLRRGKISKKPCEKCGSEKSQMHHPDYNRPLMVIWMCRECHLKHHAVEHSIRRYHAA